MTPRATVESTLADLVAKLERATEGSPALGAEILAAARGARLLSYEQYGEELWIAVEAPDGERYEINHLKNPTLSLDAAHGLINDDWYFELFSQLRNDDDRPVVMLCRRGFDIEAIASTLPLVLSLAALKAWQAEGQSMIPRATVESGTPAPNGNAVHKLLFAGKVIQTLTGNAAVRARLDGLAAAINAPIEALIAQRDNWHRDAQRLSGGLCAIHEAPSSATVAALKSVAYDIALNCIDSETARHQIEERSRADVEQLASVQIILADRRLAKLGNALSDCIHEALVEGIEIDAAASVAVAVAADYWLSEEGYDRPVTALAGILEAKANQRAGGGLA